MKSLAPLVLAVCLAVAATAGCTSPRSEREANLLRESLSGMADELSALNTEAALQIRNPLLSPAEVEEVAERYFQLAMRLHDTLGRSNRKVLAQEEGSALVFETALLRFGNLVRDFDLFLLGASGKVPGAVGEGTADLGALLREAYEKLEQDRDEWAGVRTLPKGQSGAEKPAPFLKACLAAGEAAGG
jgi:hypothetical protein